MVSNVKWFPEVEKKEGSKQIGGIRLTTVQTKEGKGIAKLGSSVRNTELSARASEISHNSSIIR